MSKNLKDAAKFAKHHAELVAARASQPKPTARDVSEFESWLDGLTSEKPASDESFELNPTK